MPKKYLYPIEILRSPTYLTRRNLIKLVLLAGNMISLAELNKDAISQNDRMNEQESNERFKRGLAKLKEIDGEAGEKVIESLKDIAPDLARYVIEYPFGDVYSREGLDLKSREIATFSALTAMGNAIPQLKVHVHGALNVGCSREEIVEIMIQMSVYAGFPAALNGIFAAREVFRERDSQGMSNT